TAADIDDSRVLTGALQYGRTASRQPLQVDARTLVAAVFAPHHAEDAEFGVRGLPFQDRNDALVFGFCQIVLLKDVLGNHLRAPANAFTIDSKINFPSVLPKTDSLDRSGCGIMPRTFRPAFTMPAILWIEPLGLASAEASPFAST